MANVNLNTQSLADRLELAKISKGLTEGKDVTGISPLDNPANIEPGNDAGFMNNTTYDRGE